MRLKVGDSLWRFLVLASVPLASFLSFSVQPIVGKFLVPWHGGAASTWIGSMLFFQCALLMGYLWAYRLGRLPAPIQRKLTIVLAIVAALATVLPPPRLLQTSGLGEVMVSLTVALLPALMLLFSTSLVLHNWYRSADREVPYFLYALSNVGSFGALAAYPFLIEPRWGLGVQVAVWRALLVILSGALVVVALGASSRGPAPSDTREEQIPTSRKLLWLWLSALTCICMLGATQLLSGEIGSNPLSWIIPLGLYLGSFALTFTGWWRAGANHFCLLILAIALTGYMLLKGVQVSVIAGWVAIWLVVVVAAACCLGTGLLYQLRPRKDFMPFYVTVAVGGVIGGFFSSLSAPNLLPRNYEFFGAAILLLASGVAFLVESRHGWRMAITGLVAVTPFAGIIWVQLKVENSPLSRVHHVRNLYGHIAVVQQPGLVQLRSETTGHGAQVNLPESARRRPTLYYVESSGVGVVLQRLQDLHDRLNVGVVGLGVGTLAAYSRPGDDFTFWDVDPKVFWLAESAFSYLRDAQGTITQKQADGRKGLEEPGPLLDLIVVDAFTGDAIPTHLVTREAFEIYVDRLTPQGLFMIHASNRYADLTPVISASAVAMGWEALRVHTDVREAASTKDLHPSPSNYVLVHRPEQREQVDSWFAESEDDGRVRRALSRLKAGDPRLVEWTDDRHSMMDVLDFNLLLGRGR